jgi:hypothetical protein
MRDPAFDAGDAPDLMLETIDRALIARRARARHFACRNCRVDAVQYYHAGAKLSLDGGAHARRISSSARAARDCGDSWKAALAANRAMSSTQSATGVRAVLRTRA